MKQLSSQFLVMVAILLMNTGYVWGDKCVKDSYSCHSPTLNHCSTHAKIETDTFPIKIKKCVNNGYAQDPNGKLTTCMYLCDDKKGYHCPCH